MDEVVEDSSIGSPPLGCQTLVAVAAAGVVVLSA
jgi:hypothetical protein